jgi:NhaA family Na+:H+ antiporter
VRRARRQQSARSRQSDGRAASRQKKIGPLVSDARENPPSARSTPPGAWHAARATARRLISPVERFLSIEASSGILLLAAAVVALVWANSPWRGGYERMLHTPLGFRIGGFAFERDLDFLVDDVLMVVFFFVVGLEIKLELFLGQLSSLRKAALPAIAALGGMLVPASIYLALNAGTPWTKGWGVPMATDIAFAVGVLALLGKRVPPPLRILLLALAVIDDLGAIIVIALFYSSGISVGGLALAVAGVFVILLMQKIGVRTPWAYVLPGVVIWVGTYVGGVHPTIAGVTIGLCTPVRAWPGREDRSPAERLQGALHGWVAFAIMPLFALSNAGVSFDHAQLGGSATVLVGVVVGLVVGKPIGVVGLSWLAVRAGVADLPSGVRWSGVLVVGLVAGIGFTMALFIATLAFPPGAPIDVAKLGVLLASVAAGSVGLIAGRLLLPAARRPSEPSPQP